MGSQSESLGNLKQFAAITTSYAADYQDRFWAFSWTRQNLGPSQYPDLLSGITDGVSAQSAQFTDLVRRRGGQPSLARIPNFYPAVRYSHLALADYLNTNLFLPFAVSPGDQNLRRWHENPAAYVAGQFSPSPGNTTAMFGTSYELSPAFFSDARVTATTGAIVQGAGHSVYAMAWMDPITGVRRVSEVLYPASKVHLNDNAQNQGNRAPAYWMFPDSRAPVLMVDGSGAVRTTGSANPGWNPEAPTSPSPRLSIMHRPRGSLRGERFLRAGCGAPIASRAAALGAGTLTGRK